MKKLNLLFLFILIIGASIRLYDLNWETFGDGEIEIYQAATEFLKGNFINNFYIFSEAPLGKYLFTAFSLITPVEFGMRLISVIFGIATIIAVFYLTKRLYDDKWMPLLASLFTAFSIIHIQFSRYVQLETMLSFFYVITFYLFFEFLKKRTNRNAILLGIVSALGLLIKFAFIYALLTLFIFFITERLISFKKNHRSSISIDNKLIKTFFAFILTFFLIWPNSLYPLNTHFTVYVEDSFDTHKIDRGIPVLLLTLGYRFTELGTAITDNVFLNLPIIGNLFFFMVKESMIFILLFFVGLLAILKKPKEKDFYVLIILAVFFVLVWLQDLRYTCRYLTIIIPFLAIVSARSILLIKKYIPPQIVFCIIFIIMFAYTLIAQPNYALFYNELQPTLKIPESETRYGEGIRDLVNDIANCSSVLISKAYIFKIEYHYPGLANYNTTHADCVVTDETDKTIDDYIKQRICNLTNTITKKGKDLFKIYSC